MARRAKGGTGTKQETDKVPEEEFGKGFNDVLKTPRKTLLSVQFTFAYLPLPTLIQGNLKKALAMTDKPMKVNSECQQYRKSRTGGLKIYLIVLFASG